MEPIKEIKDTPKSITDQKESQKGFGLGVVGSLWWIGALFIFTPAFLGIVNGWKIPFITIGMFLILISIFGAFQELSKIIENDGYTYLGIGLFFLTPAIVLFIIVNRTPMGNAVSILLKILTLLLAFIGGTGVFTSIPKILTKKHLVEPNKKMSLDDKKSDAPKTQVTVKTKIEIIVNIFIALLSLITAIFTFLTKILQIK